MAILMDWRMRAAACSLFVSGPCIANLIEDSQTALELRNFYMNRDFRQSTAAQAKAEDWAQGAMRCANSGRSMRNARRPGGCCGLVSVEQHTCTDYIGINAVTDGNAGRRLRQVAGIIERVGLRVIASA